MVVGFDVIIETGFLPWASRGWKKSRGISQCFHGGSSHLMCQFVMVKR